MLKAGKVAQLRKADRQGRDGCVKGGTLAETLAEQSKLNGASPKFGRQDRRLLNTGAGWCIAVVRRFRVERRAGGSRSSVMASTSVAAGPSAESVLLQWLGVTGCLLLIPSWSRSPRAYGVGEGGWRMRVVLLGPPGAGKGTQADRIADRFQLVHVATGDILRANVAGGTPLGEVAQAYLDSGELVPDDVVVAMMLERLTQPDCAQGFLLDGFPRSVAQARALDQQLAELGTPLDAAINLEVAEEELLHRLARRGRADDNAETVRRRLQVFVSSTRPLLDYYDGQGLLFSVAAAGTIDEVSERILHAPAEVTRHDPPAGSEPVTSRSGPADFS
jgi:adenylate kinase